MIVSLKTITFENNLQTVLCHLFMAKCPALAQSSRKLFSKIMIVSLKTITFGNSLQTVLCHLFIAKCPA